jgi:hypothetical protein
MKKKVYKYSRAEIKQVFANLPIWRDEDYTPEDGLVFIDMLLALADKPTPLKTKPEKECKHDWCSYKNADNEYGIICRECGKYIMETPLKTKPETYLCPICKTEQLVNIGHECKPTPLNTKPEIEHTEQDLVKSYKPEIEVPEKLEPLNFDFDEASCVSDRYMFQKAINNIISWANSVTKLLEER